MDTPYIKWTIWDAVKWYCMPEALGGGKPHIQKFKDGWIVYNRNHIVQKALENSIEPELLASVAWVELAGDPYIIDYWAYYVRLFDWSGPDWIDNHLTLTSKPAKTSFGAISIQLRVAAETMGINPKTLSYSQEQDLISALDTDVRNLDIVARHLSVLFKHDFPKGNGLCISEDQIRVVGARYNRGMGISIQQLRQNTKYGDFLLRNLPRIKKLLNK